MARHIPGAAASHAQRRDSAARGAAIGSVLGLTLRATGPAATGQALAVPLAYATAGLGLEGDRHTDPWSPRQVLLAGAPAYAQHGLAPHTLRENVLLDVDTAALSSGTLLRLGDTAVLALTFHCEACRYLEARHPGIAGVIGKRRGVLARVLQGGTVRVGDPVVRMPETVSAWSDDWRERVAHILAQVPEGMVVEYRQLARLAGVQAVYCRALPGLARRLGWDSRAVAQTGRPAAPRWQGDRRPLEARTTGATGGESATVESSGGDEQA
ncbi:MOSC domain-containing protein [Massilia sp. YMA4]|uniref:MOSC domain-containing protein n=1 Tax=Massilia sp. YMA4 TaxID=1593482 RepID=UPI000DD15F48|nr:MOSC domain-containing protein [Massilia sp. YMA4]AXA90334.1 hypothetical protein DPH57_03605 [Massilia sp. YMA4]